MPDPFDILRANTPNDGAKIDPYGPEAARILSHVIQVVDRQQSSSHRRVDRLRQRRTVLLAVGAAVLVLATAMAWFIATRTIDDPAITCYESTSLDANRVGTVADGVPAPAACVPYWQDGTLQLVDQPVGAVPPLTGCVTPGGGLAVFPTNDPSTCQRLRLADPSTDQPTTGLDALAAARAQITEYIQSAPCQPINEAHETIRRILDRNGLTVWTVHIMQGPPGDQCASVAYRTTDRAIDIVPIPE
jgi:hypothetical protein